MPWNVGLLGLVVLSFVAVCCGEDDVAGPTSESAADSTALVTLPDDVTPATIPLSLQPGEIEIAGECVVVHVDGEQDAVVVLPFGSTLSVDELSIEIGGSDQVGSVPDHSIGEQTEVPGGYFDERRDLPELEPFWQCADDLAIEQLFWTG